MEFWTSGNHIFQMAEPFLQSLATLVAQPSPGRYKQLSYIYGWQLRLVDCHWGQYLYHVFTWFTSICLVRPQMAFVFNIECVFQKVWRLWHSIIIPHITPRNFSIMSRVLYRRSMTRYHHICIYHFFTIVNNILQKLWNIGNCCRLRVIQFGSNL